MSRKDTWTWSGPCLNAEVKLAVVPFVGLRAVMLLVGFELEVRLWEAAC